MGGLPKCRLIVMPSSVTAAIFIFLLLDPLFPRKLELGPKTLVNRVGCGAVSRRFLEDRPHLFIRGSTSNGDFASHILEPQWVGSLGRRELDPSVVDRYTQLLRRFPSSRTAMFPYTIFFSVGYVLSMEMLLCVRFWPIGWECHQPMLYGKITK